MTKAQEVLITIIGKQLFSNECELPTVEDWDSVLYEALQQAVFPIAFSYLEDMSLINEVRQAYIKQNAEYQASAIRNFYYHSELHKLLSANNIMYVILKGQASAYYYSDPILRVMGDVDFLIHKEERDKVDQLLLDKGLRS